MAETYDVEQIEVCVCVWSDPHQVVVLDCIFHAPWLLGAFLDRLNEGLVCFRHTLLLHGAWRILGSVLLHHIGALLALGPHPGFPLVLQTVDTLLGELGLFLLQHQGIPVEKLTGGVDRVCNVDLRLCRLEGALLPVVHNSTWWGAIPVD